MFSPHPASFQRPRNPGSIVEDNAFGSLCLKLVQNAGSSTRQAFIRRDKCTIVPTSHIGSTNSTPLVRGKCHYHT